MTQSSSDLVSSTTESQSSSNSPLALPENEKVYDYEGDDEDGSYSSQSSQSSANQANTTDTSTASTTTTDTAPTTGATTTITTTVANALYKDV